jgi:hypothetical protein
VGSVIPSGASAERFLVTSNANSSTNITVFRNSSNTAKFEFYLNSSGNSELYLGSNLRISEVGSSYFNGGNVGIGTTAPTQLLHVFGNLPSGTTRARIENSGNSLIQVQSGASKISSTAFSNGVVWEVGSDTDQKFKIAGPNGDVALLSTNTRLTIDSTGNVGIGTTAPSSKLHVAETWNNAGTTFCAIKSVITDTNSAAGSDFLELYAGSATQPLKLDIQKTGQVNIYGAWTDTSNYERLSISGGASGDSIISTNRTGTGVARGLDVQTDGVSRIYIPASNAFINVNTNILVFNGSQIRFSTNVRFTSASDGILRITSSSEADFVRLQIGGNTDSFPAIARDGAGIKFTGAAAGLTSHIKVPAVAVLSLPVASTAGVGARAFVNDALAPVFGNTVATGGAVAVPVYSDGSAWKVG